MQKTTTQKQSAAIANTFSFWDSRSFLFANFKEDNQDHFCVCVRVCVCVHVCVVVTSDSDLASY